VIRSSRAHSESPQRLIFNLITLEANLDAARRTMECFDVCGRAGSSSALACMNFVALPEEWLKGRIRVVADPKVTGQLASPLNFARFYLPRLFPHASRVVLYLDSDMIVHGDLVELWRSIRLPPQVAAAAVTRHDAHFRMARYERTCSSIFTSRYGHDFNRSAETFNAGLMAVDVREWDRQHLTEEAEWWMSQHAGAHSPSGLWALGSQPVCRLTLGPFCEVCVRRTYARHLPPVHTQVMHLILHGRWLPLPDHWNVDGLGRVPNIPERKLSEALVLHWTGKRKPWLLQGLYAKIFLAHVPPHLQKRCNTGRVRGR
jgi:hypothetical protein